MEPYRTTNGHGQGAPTLDTLRAVERAASALGYVDRWLVACEARQQGGDAQGATACLLLAHDALDDARADLSPRWTDEAAEAVVGMPPGTAETVRRHLLACPSGSSDADGHRCECGRSAALRCRGCGELLAVAHEPGAPPCQHYSDAAAWLAEGTEAER